MKTSPTSVVALAIHALVTLMAGLVWRLAVHREFEFRQFGSALPGPTQVLYDVHLPALILTALLMSLAFALALRRSAGTLISALAASVALPLLGLCILVLRLPLHSP